VIKPPGGGASAPPLFTPLQPLQLLFGLIVLLALLLLFTLLAVVLFHFGSPPKDFVLIVAAKTQNILSINRQKGLPELKACAKMEN